MSTARLPGAGVSDHEMVTVIGAEVGTHVGDDEQRPDRELRVWSRGQEYLGVPGVRPDDEEHHGTEQRPPRIAHPEPVAQAATPREVGGRIRGP